MPKKTTKAKNSKTAKQTNSQHPLSFTNFISFFNHNFSLIFLVLVFFLGGFISGSLWTENQLFKSDGSNLKKNAQVADIEKDSDSPSAPSLEEPSSNLENLPTITEQDHIRGSIDPKITLVEYSDYECPFCNRFHPTMKKLLEEYPNDIAWVYRHYPLPFHSQAQPTAEMAECVAQLGGNEYFWQFSDEVYSQAEAQGPEALEEENLLAIVDKIGLVSSAVKTCVDSGENTKLVTDQKTGGEKAGIQGTPGTVLITKDGEFELISGALPYEQVKAVVEKYLD
jgi:protein-disulfide isomerase